MAQLAMGLPLAEYRAVRPIRESPRSRVYEAISERDSSVVIAKVFDIQDEADEARVQHEFELIRRLDDEGIVRALELRRVGQQLVLLLERVPGTNLAEYADGRPIPLEQFWSIAEQIADILARTHAARVIHRDIKPANILLDPSSQRVYLADFGISVVLESERRHIYDNAVFVGTLPYISPEQTGRTSRVVDFRSDLYSLGVTFYELLTGERPFESSDPLELIHAHLAREADPPVALRRDIPLGLSKLIMKLLSKAPEDRYQTARGLASDLRALHAAQLAGENTMLFQLGRDDRERVLRIPQRVVGRERELGILRQTFGVVAETGGRRTLAVVGQLGVGKTRLVTELESEVIERNGYMVRGEFGSEASAPLAGFTDALTSLFEQQLTESDARLERWRRLLQSGLGSLSSVVAKLVPTFELIVGKQAKAPLLDGNESRNRLQVALERLLTVVCSTGPMVLVLENFHFADFGSVRLFEALAEGETGPLLLIPVVRGEGLDTDHMLGEVFERLEDHPRFETLELGGLSTPAIQRLIEQTLDGVDEPEVLARLLQRKTAGIPLFVANFLPRLVDGEALWPESEGWRWDPVKVEAEAIPEDAAKLMAGRLDDLDRVARDVARHAACAGPTFDLERLGWICEEPPEVLFVALVRLEDAGVISRFAGGYRFVHRSLCEAAGADLDPEIVRGLRWMLGQALRPRLEQSEGLLFEVVDHLDAGRDRHLGSAERIELARLNLEAARAALAAGLLSPARAYLEQGLELSSHLRVLVVNRGPSVPNYDLVFGLYFGQAQVAVAEGERSEADAALERVQGWPLSDLDYARVIAARLELMWADARHQEAVELGLEALERLGLDVPPKPARPEALLELLEAWGMVATMDLRFIDELPPCEDDTVAGQIEIITELKRIALGIDNDLFLYVVGLHATSCHEHGYHPTMPQALNELAIGVSAALDRVEDAVKIQDLACELARERPGGVSETRLLALAGGLTLHRVRSFAEVIARFEASYVQALEVGEFDSAGLLGGMAADMKLDVGVHLRVIDRNCVEMLAEVGRWCPNQTRVELWMLRGLCRALGGSNGDDEDVWTLEPEAVLERKGTATNFHAAQVLRGILALIEGDAAAALGHCEPLFERGDDILYTSTWARASVVLASAYYIQRLAGRPDTPELGEAVRACEATLASWAETSPANYGHYLDLVHGLRHAHAGEGQQAVEALDRAWAEARHRGCRWIEGLAAEQLAAEFERQGLRAPIEGVIRRIWQAYEAWGARTKLEALEQQHPALFVESRAPWSDTRLPRTREPTATDRRLSESHLALMASSSLDLGQVLRSVGAISEDLRLDEVIARVLDAALTNVGADHALLILEQGGEHALVAEADGVGEREIFADPPLLREVPERAPLSLINFVARTAKVVVLDDASEDLRFAGDAYLEESEVRSVIAMPLLKGERRLGVLVLENHLTTHGFGSVSLQALRLITSQAASTLENAQLYNELRRSQERWRSLVDGAPDLIALLDERGAVVFRNHDGPLRGIDETHDEDEGGALTSESAERWNDAVEAVIGQGIRRELELEFRTEAGERQYFAVRVAPIEIQRGLGSRRSIVHRNAVAVATDITSRRAAENEMRELEAQLRQQQRLESVGTLASGVAHEINNPIQGIMNYADLIYGNADDHDLVVDFASEINLESRRVAKIVRNLLAFSRQDATEVPEPVLLGEVVDASLSLIRAVLRRDQISVEVNTQDKLPRVMCRAQQIQQVIMNLVTNARDALNERYGEYHQRKRVAIEVAASSREGWQVIRVRDWGPGIPEGVLARIFDPFYTTKGRDQGTGLGLAVSHGIVQDHDSELEVTTEVGEGTTFSFELREFHSDD